MTLLSSSAKGLGATEDGVRKMRRSSSVENV